MVFMLDFLKVSRPGWWIVTVWLYVAPASNLDTKHFWAGLFYVCIPLNVVIYGLNDYADVEVDVSNTRKGNWIFGPKGMTRKQLRPILQIAIASTAIPLLIWGWWNKQTMRYLLWFVLGMANNVAYNFEALGRLSARGPWEIPLVYVGFAMVTVLSYWLNGDGNNGSIVWATGEELLWFGCNTRYWTHLGFLVTRSQLWTEYMDYESDRFQNRGTTLAKLSSKTYARALVLFVLLTEAIWNWYQYQFDVQWKTLYLFSVLGVVSFLLMEFNSSSKGDGVPSPDALVWLALIQNTGGLWLIQDCWNKRIFVT